MARRRSAPETPERRSHRVGPHAPALLYRRHAVGSDVAIKPPELVVHVQEVAEVLAEREARSRLTVHPSVPAQDHLTIDVKAQPLALKRPPPGRSPHFACRPRIGRTQNALPLHHVPTGQRHGIRLAYHGSVIVNPTP